ncbi:MAG: transposase domain-containing protein [Egibacteraceae bacterium]
MPRAGQVKPPSDEWLSDRIAIGTLTRPFLPELGDEVIAATGRAEQRQRLLPARVTLDVGLGQQGGQFRLCTAGCSRRTMNFAQRSSSSEKQGSSHVPWAVGSVRAQAESRSRSAWLKISAAEHGRAQASGLGTRTRPAHIREGHREHSVQAAHTIRL